MIADGKNIKINKKTPEKLIIFRGQGYWVFSIK